MVAGKAGPKPPPVNKQSREEKRAAKEAADAARAETKKREKEERDRKAAETKAAKDAQKAQDKATKEAAKAAAKGPTPSPVTQVTDAERNALFVREIKNLEDLIKDKDAVVTKIRNLRKKIISYDYKAKDIDFALELNKRDQPEMIEEHRRRQMIAYVMGHPLGTQPDILDMAAHVDRTPAVDRAERDGFGAGARGEQCRPPYHDATEQAQRWIKGWHDGQAALLSGMKKLEAPTEPPKTDGQGDMLGDGIGEADAPAAEQKPQPETVG